MIANYALKDLSRNSFIFNWSSLGGFELFLPGNAVNRNCQSSILKNLTPKKELVWNKKKI